MMLVSLILGIVEPISAGMVAIFVMRHSERLRLYWWMRAFLALVAIGLVIQAAQHWALVYDYRPPRTWSWLVLSTAINGLIWAVSITDFYRSSKGWPVWQVEKGKWHEH